MSLKSLLIFFYLLLDNVISDNNWIIENAKSVILVSNETKMDLFIISVNESNLMIKREDAYGRIEQNIYDFNNDFDDLTINAILYGNYSEKLILFYDKYFQIYNDQKLINKKYEIPSGFFRTTLKVMQSFILFISSDFKLVQIKIEEKDNNDFIITKESKSVFADSLNINSIFCDVSKDGKYYICSYFSSENIELALFSEKLTLISTKKLNTGVINAKNHFNKILFLKDNYKIVAINAENNDDIRLHYLEIQKNKINLIKLNKEKNKEDEYIDIKETQLDNSYLYNDIVILENDEIFKFFMKDDIFLMSKIQFYKDNKLLTIRTKNYPNYINKASNIHLLRKNNGIIIYFNNGTHFQFLRIGHINTNINNFINNNDFKISNYEIQSILQTKQFVEVESIPENFSFIKAIENTFLVKGSIIYPEEDTIKIISYITNNRFENLYLQTKLIYEFPSDSNIQIFPTDEIDYPPETKIISFGNKGYLSFKIDSCNNGHYYINNTEICTSIRPTGYYFDNNKNIFAQCHNNCAECLTFSDDDSNMKCLQCKSGYIYNESTFNCAAIKNYVPKTVSIELVNNAFFWVFLVVMIIAIIISFLIVCQDKVCKKCKKVSSITVEDFGENSGLLNSKIDEDGINGSNTN